MNYSRYKDKVKQKLSQYGGDVKITRKGETTYDSTTNSYISNDIVINGKGLLSSIDSSFINGTTVLIGDVMMMCSLGDKPVINDKLTFGGKTYNVINIEEVNPDGNCVIYYNLQLR